jgi:hypothetical protein
MTRRVIMMATGTPAAMERVERICRPGRILDIVED